MSNESNRHVQHDSGVTSDVKASDFFPPGTGWNQAPTTEKKQVDEQLDARPDRPDAGRAGVSQPLPAAWLPRH